MPSVPNRYSDYHRTQLARALELGASSNRMDEMGDQPSALAEMEKSVDIFRKLSVVDPDAINEPLGMALKKMARLLREEGRGKEAVDAIQESVDVYRVQADKAPEMFIPYLATTLCDLTFYVAETYPDQKERAFASGQETVSLYRQLATAYPGEYNQDLALALNYLSKCYNVMDDHENAINSINESLDLYRELENAERSTALQLKVADGLFNLSTYLNNAGRKLEALDAIQEASDLHRALAVVNPGAFNEDLALSLMMLSIRLNDMGRLFDSLTAMQEARKLDGELAAKNPFVFDPRPGEPLQLEDVLSLDVKDTANRREEAIRAIKEMVQTYTRLYKQDPDRFRPHLDMSLKALKQVML